MDRDALNVMPLLTKGWQIMTKYSMECILGFIIYSVMCAVIQHLAGYIIIPVLLPDPHILAPTSAVPTDLFPTSRIMTSLVVQLLVGALSSALLTSPLTGGMLSISLRAAWGQRPDLSQLFSEFRNYSKWVLVSLIRMGLSLFTMTPFWIACWVSRPYIERFLSSLGSASSAVGMIAPLGPAIPILLLGLVAWAAIGTIVLARWYFVEFVMVEGMSVLDAFEHSARMTQDIRMQVIGYSFAVFILAILISLFTCGLGDILFAPIAFYGRAAMYAEVRYQLAGMRSSAASYHY